MRVLIVTGIFPPDIGGPARYVPKVARFLTDAGHRVIVVTLTDDTASMTSETVMCRSRAYRVVRFPRRRGGLLSRITRVTALLARFAKTSDVVFVNGLPIEARIATWVTGTPHVTKVVGDWVWERAVARGWTDAMLEDFQGQPQGPPLRLMRRIHGNLLTTACRVIVPSEYLARLVESWGTKATRVEIIYNGIELDGYGTDAEQRRAEEPFRLVTVSRLVPWKRVDGLIDAVSRVKEVTLTIVGDGPERQALESRVRVLGIDERVTFIGAVASDLVPRYLEAADLFVLNSSYEGLPHVVVEAYAVGLPVVATDVGGTSEIIQKGGGRLIDTQEELVGAIHELRDDPALRSRLAAEARHVVRTFFGEDQMLAGTVDVLRACADENVQ